MTGIDHQPLEIRLLYHRFQHFFPDALVSPATETPLDSIPLTIFRRQVSPWCSRSQNPEHAIQKLTGILCVASPRSLVSYCVRLENFPHRIGHIVPSIAVLHEETPLCVFLHYTTKRHFCRQCLEAEHPGLYERLILKGTLNRHLADANERAIRMLERLIVQMAAQEGITESLKKTQSLEWVSRMNSIRSRAEEIILHEVILTL